METNNTQPSIKFSDLVDNSPNGVLMVMFSYEKRPSGTDILTQLCLKHGVNEKTAILNRATSDDFPHPVGIGQGCPTLAYLYSEKDFVDWLSKRNARKIARIRRKEGEMKRILDKARELERKAYALRQEHRNFKINITDKEKANEDSN
jgi:hypothetical protein